MFSEANWMADALSKYRHKPTNPQIYINHQKLPKQAKPYYHLDLFKMPNFRRKKTKNIKEPLEQSGNF